MYRKKINLYVGIELNTTSSLPMKKKKKRKEKNGIREIEEKYMRKVEDYIGKLTRD